MSCQFCNNANTDSNLTPDNDLSYFGIGISEPGYDISFRSGDNRPTEIIFRDNKLNTYTRTAGRYVPKFCPECGRKLFENNSFFEKIGGNNK